MNHRLLVSILALFGGILIFSSCEKEVFAIADETEVFIPGSEMSEDDLPQGIYDPLDRPVPLILNGDTLLTWEADGHLLVDGDVILPTEFVEAAGGRAAWNRSVRIWRNRTVYYVFDRALPRQLQTSFTLAAREWTRRTGIRFVYRTHQADYIRVFRGKGNYSHLGRRGGKQDLSLEDANVGTAIHEIGHALGLIHEHQRRDRHQHVLVYNGLQSDGNFQQNYASRNYGGFDWGSIMLYGSSSLGNGYWTMVRASNYKPFWNSIEWYRYKYGNSTTYGRYARPSSQDAAAIKYLYN